MELVFKRSEQVLSGKPAYEVEFKASSDFNIHIERPEGGRFLHDLHALKGIYVEIV